FFTGEVQIADYMPKLDIILLSSISEGMPLAVLEAMACAKPCVTTDVGSCRELLEGYDDDFGHAGYVVPVMHYDQLAAAAIRLCKNGKLRSEMGLNGLARTRKQYTRELFIERYRDTYSRYEGGF